MGTARRQSEARYAELARRIDAIEVELRRLGLWDLVPAPSEQDLRNAAPFGGDVLPFEGWLQHVFVPRVHEVVAGTTAWPRSSQVGVAAMRALDGEDEARELVALLHDFDRFIEA